LFAWLAFDQHGTTVEQFAVYPLAGAASRSIPANGVADDSIVLGSFLRVLPDFDLSRYILLPSSKSGVVPAFVCQKVVKYVNG
jgi:hypothetical protein